MNSVPETLMQQITPEPGTSVHSANHYHKTLKIISFRSGDRLFQEESAK